MKLILNRKDLTNLSWTKLRESSGTTGSYLKSYSYSNGKKVYYKLSFFDDINGVFGYESINEIIASRLMYYLDVPHLDYDLIHALIKIDNKSYDTYLLSSLDFKGANESKITMENFYELNKKENESKIEFLSRYDLLNDIYKMFVVDHLIVNRDRHGANIEVLFNSKTKKYRLAPLFDQGLSLLSPFYKKEDILNFNTNEERRVNYYFGSSDLVNNLRLVPKELFPNEIIDFEYLFQDLDSFVDNDYLDKCRKLIEKRWTILEDIRNKK